MKYKILLLSVMFVFMTGCGKEETLTCTSENTTQGAEFKSVVDIEIKKDMVTNATATITYQDEEVANKMCNVFKFAQDSEQNLECNGKVITYKNFHKSANSTGTSTKEEFVEYMKNNGYVCE